MASLGRVNAREVLGDGVNLVPAKAKLKVWCRSEWPWNESGWMSLSKVKERDASPGRVQLGE